MTFKFTPHTDAGSPQFTNLDGILSIICGPSDRGRWLCDSEDPVAAGQNLKLTMQVRTTGTGFAATVYLIWWKDQPGFVLHDSELIEEISRPQDLYRTIEHRFTVPTGVRMPRVDLRAWSGAGTVHLKEIQITADSVPPDPPGPDPVPPAHQLTIDLRLNTAVWRVTANEDSITALRIPL